MLSLSLNKVGSTGLDGILEKGQWDPWWQPAATPSASDRGYWMTRWCCCFRGQPARWGHGRRQQELPLWVCASGSDPRTEGHHQGCLVRAVHHLHSQTVCVWSAHHSSLCSQLIWSHSAFYSPYFVFVFIYFAHPRVKVRHQLLGKSSPRDLQLASLFSVLSFCHWLFLLSVLLVVSVLNRCLVWSLPVVEVKDSASNLQSNVLLLVFSSLGLFLEPETTVEQWPLTKTCSIYTTYLPMVMNLCLWVCVSWSGLRALVPSIHFLSLLALVQDQEQTTDRTTYKEWVDLSCDY